MSRIVFVIRGDARGPSRALAPHVAGAAVARAGELWLLVSGRGLVLLEVSEAEPDVRHRRVADAAEHLRRELFELLTVAPFIEPLVVVPPDATPGPAEVPADLVRNMVGPDPLDPLVARVRRAIDAGLLTPPWHRHDGHAVAG